MIKKFLNFYPCVFEVEGGICDMINKTMYQNRATRVVWKQILPMLQGKILYYPDTPAVRKIIKEVNTKVSQLTLKEECIFTKFCYEKEICLSDCKIHPYMTCKCITDIQVLR